VLASIPHWQEWVVFMHVKVVLICTLLLVVQITASGQTYPVTISANSRYLTDHNGKPFLVVGDSPQALIGNLSWNISGTNGVRTYFQNRVGYGFNTVWINLLCDNYTYCAANGHMSDNGTAGSGPAPFTSGSNPNTYDICGSSNSNPATTPCTTPNSAYFTRVDSVLTEANNVGLLVWLDPIETGGFLETQNTIPNNCGDYTTDTYNKCYKYGYWLGQRYNANTFPNIVWMSGNDFGDYVTTDYNNEVLQVMKGIKDGETAAGTTPLPQTIEIQNSGNVWVSYSHQDTAAFNGNAYTPAGLVNLDSIYTYYDTYNGIWNAYNASPTVPAYMVEANYEFEDNLSAGCSNSTQIDHLCLREQEWWTMTSGATGQLYGSANTVRIGANGYLAGYYGWPYPQMQAGGLDTPGALQFGYLASLLRTGNNGQPYPWWNLVPNTNDTFITAGNGNKRTSSLDIYNSTYATAAVTTDGTFALLYSPSHHNTLTLNLSSMAGPVTGKWYDPSDGTLGTTISLSNTSGQVVTMPGNNSEGSADWVLVLTTTAGSIPAPPTGLKAVVQ
jgi:hypothetical protein